MKMTMVEKDHIAPVSGIYRAYFLRAGIHDTIDFGRTDGLVRAACSDRAFGGLGLPGDMLRRNCLRVQRNLFSARLAA